MKILVASSGSHAGSADPVTAAASFPWPEHSEIQVLTVAEAIHPVVAVPQAVPDVPPIVDLADAQLNADAIAESAAASAAAQLRKRGFQAEGVIREGDPETAILEYARNWGADLIVVGSRDRSLLERLLLGSVSQTVVKHSPCSVLVIKQSPG
jgi:nucleotide-binding universal stress UspA family protein